MSIIRRVACVVPVSPRDAHACCPLCAAAARATECLATLHAAVEAGITLLDTGDFYGMGHNELLIGEALKTIGRDRILLSVKFGALAARTRIGQRPVTMHAPFAMVLPTDNE